LVPAENHKSNQSEPKPFASVCRAFWIGYLLGVATMDCGNDRGPLCIPELAKEPLAHTSFVSVFLANFHQSDLLALLAFMSIMSFFAAKRRARRISD